MTEEEAMQHKEIEFYAANLGAWFDTRMEHDKSLLTLSAGGIGLLVTLMSTVGVRSVEGLVLYIAALVAFLICLVSIVWIFKKNSTHPEAVNRSDAVSDPVLRLLDGVAVGGGIAGVFLSSSLGISAAVAAFNSNGEHMADQRDIG